MHNLVRFYNQNRKSIWRTILIIIAIIIFIRLLNYFTVKNSEVRSNTDGLKESNETNILQGSTYTSKKSAVSGTTIQKSKLNHIQELFDSFFDSCNNHNIENAYNMLTDDCKEVVYPTIESFEENYYNNLFEGNKKIYSFINWHENTYYITLKDDILTSGKINSNDNIKNDYITVVDDKLNIRSFIGKSQIEKNKVDKNIEMKVENKSTFMDYEIYNITITNKSDKTICLTSGENSDDIYIQDKNKVKYGVVNNEFMNSQMYIDAGSTRNLSFKFYSSYVSDKKITQLVFKKINLNSNNVDVADMYEYSISL